MHTEILLLQNVLLTILSGNGSLTMKTYVLTHFCLSSDFIQIIPFRHKWGREWGGEAYFRRRLLAFYDVVGQFMTSSHGAKMTSKAVEMTSHTVGMTSQIVRMTSQFFMEFTCIIGHFFASSSAVKNPLSRFFKTPFTTPFYFHNLYSN